MATLLFERSDVRWWQKPLVRLGSRSMPAELVVLEQELRSSEAGAWLNSRGTTSGVVDLIADRSGKLKTRRVPLPQFVADRIRASYEKAQIAKGAPDLVIWSDGAGSVRFVEVKCRDRDRPTPEQLLFHKALRELGSHCAIVEWRFTDG